MGANDGSITTDVKGGAPPYNYAWSTGSHKANLDKLVAGTYSVTITDQNGCVITKSITLLQPTPMTITSITATMYGAYNVRCYDGKDGAINLTVTGGMPPYKYNWSNGSFEEDPINLTAGKYNVIVTDVNKATVEGQIILTQPSKLALGLTASSFSNGYNISCYGCSNGTITTTVTGGTSPFSYLWDGKGVTGQATANITNLGPGGYGVIVTDANGCKTDNKTFLSEPPSNSSDKNGNVIAGGEFLGSTNATPLVLKTSNTEQMRITENGNVGIGTNNPLSKLEVSGNADVIGTMTARQGLKFDNDNGIGLNTTNGMSTLNFGRMGVSYRTPACSTPPSNWVNMFGGILQIYDWDPLTHNVVTNSGLLNLQAWPGGSSIDASIEGNTGPARLLLNYFCGNSTYINTGANGGDISMCTPTLGKVCIGIDPSLNIKNYKLAVNGTIGAKEIVVEKTQTPWPDYVFNKNYKLTSLKDVEKYISENSHLPEVPSAKEIEQNGINVAETNAILLKKIEELTLYIIEQNKRIDALEKNRK